MSVQGTPGLVCVSEFSENTVSFHFIYLGSIFGVWLVRPTLAMILSELTVLFGFVSLQGRDDGLRVNRCVSVVSSTPLPDTQAHSQDLGRYRGCLIVYVGRQLIYWQDQPGLFITTGLNTGMAVKPNQTCLIQWL